MKTDIKIGQKFGKWTVIDDVPVYTKGGQRNVKVQCECGTIEYKHWSSLRLGKTTKCQNCKHLEHRINIEVGKKYKHWTVLKEGEQINGQLKYLCRCDCGIEQYFTASALTSDTRWFQCKKCTAKENGNKLQSKSGKCGDLTLSRVNRIRHKAELRKIEFSVSIEYLWNLFIHQNKTCALTGDPLNINTASLDRIDSKYGYIEGNVQWVTAQANKCKHILTMTELYEFCEKILRHANQQPS